MDAAIFTVDEQKLMNSVTVTVSVRTRASFVFRVRKIIGVALLSLGSRILGVRLAVTFGPNMGDAIK